MCMPLFLKGGWTPSLGIKMMHSCFIILFNKHDNTSINMKLHVHGKKWRNTYKLDDGWSRPCLLTSQLHILSKIKKIQLTLSVHVMRTLQKSSPPSSTNPSLWQWSICWPYQAYRDAKTTCTCSFSRVQRQAPVVPRCWDPFSLTCKKPRRSTTGPLLPTPTLTRPGRWQSFH
jgi:hypothetical protein